MRRACAAQNDTQKAEHTNESLRLALRDEEQFATNVTLAINANNVAHEAQVYDLKRQNEVEKNLKQMANLERGHSQTVQNNIESDLMKVHKDYNDRFERAKSQQQEIVAKDKEIGLLRNEIKHQEELRRQHDRSVERKAKEREEINQKRMENMDAQMEQLQEMYSIAVTGRSPSVHPAGREAEQAYMEGSLSLIHI